MVKKVIKYLIYGNRSSGEKYIKYLKSKGMRIGENCFVVNPRNIIIDETRPWLVEIGNDVVLTDGVTILTHGYDLAVIMNKYGELYGSAGKVKIGNNVFVGANSTILKGVTIGDNVIIGANSLVNKSFPDNVVVAGNPAKIIMSLDEYRSKRKKEYINEAKELAMEYINVYNKKPDINVFHEFFPIMLQRSKVKDVNFGFLKIKKVSDTFLQSKPIYNGLDEFLDECSNRGKCEYDE